MPHRPKSLEVRVFESFAEIEPSWSSLETHGNPTLSATWLRALEETGCVCEERGWVPHHVGIFDGELLVAAMPAYLKFNSEGEFIFDHGIARAAPKFGVRYFPKLLVAVPFTPATGPRILLPRGASSAIEGAARAALLTLVAELPISSVHVLFLGGDVAARLAGQPGLLHRHSVQFHWRNRGFETFEDFLGTMPSKRRTAIRRERKELTKQAIDIVNVRGAELDAAAADTAYELYLTTVDKFMWGRRYLNRAFFETIFQTMPASIDLVLAKPRGAAKPIAGAFNLLSETTLYGRYWGAHREVPFLHFNVCFYHSIERCIAECRGTFEPGAGGEHKLARGFSPTLTHSLHAFKNSQFAALIDDFFARERALLAAEVACDGTGD